MLASGPGPGCVVEFMQGDSPQPAMVLEEAGGRLRVYTATRREMKLPAARILPWTGPRAGEGLSRSQMDAVLAEHAERRRRLAESIDVESLWEMAQEEVRSARARWFAELVWQEPDEDQVAAMGRAMLAVKTHFKYRPPEFEIHDQATVEARSKEAEKARVRQKLATAGREFLHALWNARAGACVPEPPDEETAGRLAEVLAKRISDPSDAETASIWREMSRTLPEHPHLALVLAEKWGIVEPHHNYLLDQAGYAWGDEWAAPFAGEIERQAELVAGLGAAGTVEEGFVSIDAATTRDIDDALRVARTEDGGFRLDVAIACPPFGYPFGHELDEAVFERATSIYLPEGAANMLPERLATDVYSLVAGENRPAYVLGFVFDATGAEVSRSLELAVVRVEDNTTYQAAEAAIEADESHPLHAGWKLAGMLRAGRIQRGAVVIDRPEPEVVLSGSGAEVRVDILHKTPTPRAQLLVSESMILANEAVAAWGVANDVGLLYRTQDIALPDEFAGVWTEPQDIHGLVKQFGPSLVETKPRPHRSLALRAYAPATSPLRRYTDLVNAAQIRSVLDTGLPAFDHEALERLLPRLAARLEAAGQVQRFRPRYWKLEHVRQNKKTLFEAVAVEEAGRLVVFSVPCLQLFVRAPKDFVGEKFYPGQPFLLRFSKVDPLTNELRVGEALEA